MNKKDFLKLNIILIFMFGIFYIGLGIMFGFSEIYKLVLGLYIMSLSLNIAFLI